jgi:hypothetical protein
MVAVRERQMVEMLAQAILKVHSSNNLTEEGQRERERRRRISGGPGSESDGGGCVEYPFLCGLR